MASDVNSLIDSLNAAQHAGAETLYVNEAGQFRTAEKGFGSWLWMRLSGFNNNAVIVAQKISALVSATGDLAPYYERLKPALENFQLRIRKAKKQPVREARSQALKGAFDSLGRYSAVPVPLQSPFGNAASTRSGTPASQFTPRSNRPGTPDSSRSFESFVSDLVLPPPMISQPVPEFERLLQEAVDAEGNQYGFTDRQKAQLRESVTRLYTAGEVIENAEIHPVVAHKARELATKRNLDHLDTGWFLGERVLRKLEMRFGKVDLDAGWVRSQAGIAKTTEQFTTLLWNETERLAKKKLEDTFLAVCLGAGFTAEGLPLARERKALLRLFELEERIISQLKDAGCVRNVPHLIQDPRILRKFLLEHFAHGNTKLELDLVIKFLKRQGLHERNEETMKNRLVGLFPSGVFEVPPYIISQAAIEAIQSKQTYLAVNETDAGSFEYIGDRNYLGMVFYSPVTEAGRFMAANGEMLAQGIREDLLRNQAIELGRQSLNYEAVDSIRPLTEDRIREVWVHLLIDAALDQGLIPSRIHRPGLQALEKAIREAAKGNPIEELGRIARQEIDKLK